MVRYCPLLRNSSVRVCFFTSTDVVTTFSASIISPSMQMYLMRNGMGFPSSSVRSQSSRSKLYLKSFCSAIVCMLLFDAKLRKCMGGMKDKKERQRSRCYPTLLVVIVCRTLKSDCAKITNNMASCS